MLGFHIRDFRRGPFFDGRAQRAVRRFDDHWEEEMAEEALDHVRGTYHTHFKNPTGYYESQVRIEHGPRGPFLTDGGEAGPVYGPWLEGVGSRNQSTRFKGYHAFRKAAQHVERRAERQGNSLWRRIYNRLVN